MERLKLSPNFEGERIMPTLKKLFRRAEITISEASDRIGSAMAALGESARVAAQGADSFVAAWRTLELRRENGAP